MWSSISTLPYLMPVREPLSRCGALVIDSMPPATTTSAEPALIRSWPSIIAFMPEPQTLLMVVQPVAAGRPAPSAAWRAGAWPRPAGSTQPMITSSTLSAATPDCSRAPLMAVAPSVGVGTPVNWPSRAPMAVRLAPVITTLDMATPWVSGMAGLSPGWPGAGRAGHAGLAETARRPRRAGSVAAFEQLAADQHPADLVGAGADGIELGVAQDPPGRVFVDVAVAAQGLDGLQRHLHRGLAGVQQAGGGIDAAATAGVVVAGDLVGESAAGLQRRVHVGELGLHDAEAAHRGVELPALAHIGQGDVQGRLHQAQRAAGQHQAFGVQAAHQHLHALVDLAQDVPGGDLAVLEHQLAGVGAAHAQL